MFILQGGENEPPIDIDWDEVVNYGANSEVEQFLQNNEETHGYEVLRNQTEMGFYKIFDEGQILRDREGKSAQL